MSKCIDCKKQKNCAERRGSHKYCFEPKKQTNYDRIKAMSVEEMANFIADIYADNEHAEIRINGEWLATEDIEQWLESEVEE